MPRKAEPLESRLQRFVVVDPASGCWVWQGAKNSGGYGRIAMPNGHIGGYRDFAHRVTYEHFVGPIPEGLVIDHLCRNPSCCNPEHLEPVTQKVNLRRGNTLQAENLAKTHCAHGHEFTPENTRRTATGRWCRECGRRRSREYNARKKAGA